ncbi:MAG: SAM-dependent chlorinase/fluorinase [Candidatus Bathyarchaeia archaeon]|nr:SAM-dependent chlorinase/fluorinase [Candidatus Bathyarchaeota archaeon]
MFKGEVPIGLVGILSDFGLRDSYVAQMKAVILSRSPSTTIVDISHGIERHNIDQGMFVLASVTPYFPSGTIYLAVVDPGVGGSRRSLLLETERSKFVGPDNGLLVLAAEKEGIVNVYELDESRYHINKFSSTFHGRDIFAVAVGDIASGNAPSDIASQISDYVKPMIIKPKIRSNQIDAIALHIDYFGNVVTNISQRILQRYKIDFGCKMKIKVKAITKEIDFCKTYSDVASGQLLATIGGHGYLELSINQGNAAEHIDLKNGDKLLVQIVGLSV